MDCLASMLLCVVCQSMSFLNTAPLSSCPVLFTHLSGQGHHLPRSLSLSLSFYPLLILIKTLDRSTGSNSTSKPNHFLQSGRPVITVYEGERCEGRKAGKQIKHILEMHVQKVCTTREAKVCRDMCVHQRSAEKKYIKCIHLLLFFPPCSLWIPQKCKWWYPRVHWLCMKYIASRVPLLW